jgi:hypothetical protein
MVPKSAARKPRVNPRDQHEYGTEQNARCDGKKEAEVISLNVDIAWQSAKAKLLNPSEVPADAN